MTKSIEFRLRKLWSKEIGTLWNGEKVQIDGVTPAPPYKVGKEFPYENQRRARKLAAIQQLGPDLPEDKVGLEEYVANSEAAVAALTAPHIKSPEQMQTEAAYLGKNRHQLPKRPAKKKRGGTGWSKRRLKSFRDFGFQRNGHSVLPIEYDLVEA